MMVSEGLQRARTFEARRMPLLPDGERPVFHVTGGIGWINDPNGFSRYKGEYHLFFQYHPYAAKWGPMHWGHQTQCVAVGDAFRWRYAGMQNWTNANCQPFGARLFGEMTLSREQAASFIVYTPESADSISFEADGGVLVDVEKYDLEFDGKERVLCRSTDSTGWRNIPRH